MLKSALCLAAALATLLASALANGLRNDRWGAAPDLQGAADRLECVAPRLGEWESFPKPMSERQLKAAGVVGHLSRRFVHKPTGAEVHVLVIVGHSGPIAVHPPEVCYAGAGYRQQGDKVKHTVKGTRSAELWAATFVKQDATSESLRVFWAWGSGEDWSAADNPRLTFAGFPYLYKLYVVRPTARPDDPAEVQPASDLIELLVPELQRCLRAESPSSTGSEHG